MLSVQAKTSFSKDDFKPIDTYESQLQDFVTEKLQGSENKFSQPSSSQSHHQAYRADIDGLRTIAISIVVIFHAFPLFMPGGFIGVDVFFVISGYLISGIIIKQANNKKFSFVDFYSRRIKRIYPALIVVLIFVLIVAQRVFENISKKYTARTMAAATVFGANIEILSYNKGYFDPDTKENPLLHLWSLGVEEQFYIFWPCFISIVIYKCKPVATKLLWVYTLASFAFGIFCVYISPKFAFYFPICRFWQMSIGGIIAYRKQIINNKLLNDVLSVVGVLAIFITVWIMNEDSLFPGWWALVPTLSSAFIIQSGPESLINRTLLSSRPFVFIGKISYPLYLWHWPLLVFSRAMYPKGSTSIFSNIYFIVFLSVLFSILTYYFVENKLRFRKQKAVVIILLVTILLIGVFALSIYLDKTSSFSGRLDSDFENRPDQMPQQLKQYEREMIPGPDDYIVKNGKKLPNTSVNRNRKPTSVFKIRASRKFIQWDQAFYRPVLDTIIDQKSKYYKKDHPKLTCYEVANQGKDDQLFIVGDSHAKFITWRFQHLYRQSVKNNSTNNFPTIVALIREDSSYLPWLNDFPNFAQNFIKEHKPKRVLFVHRWIGHWIVCPNCWQGYNGKEEWYDKKITDESNTYANLMKELIDQGIDVYVGAIHVEDDTCDPRNQVDGNGIIEENLKPIILSEFRKKNQFYIDRLEGALTKVGAKLVHFSDHHCFNDICEKLAPSGYSFYIDTNHYGKLYNRYWASSVDFLAQF